MPKFTSADNAALNGSSLLSQPSSSAGRQAPFQAGVKRACRGIKQRDDHSFLQRYHQRRQKLKYLNFKELLNSKSELPVLALPNGEQKDNRRAKFLGFLKSYKLLKCPRAEKSRTLYRLHSLRHTYAKFALTLSKTEIHLLARQMGTSIAMIDYQYSHLVPRMRSSDLNGKERGEVSDYSNFEINGKANAHIL